MARETMRASIRCAIRNRLTRVSKNDKDLPSSSGANYNTTDRDLFLSDSNLFLYEILI